MEGQIWMVVALLSIVGVVTCSALAAPQLLYNSDGTPQLQIINRGAIGQSIQGRMSWQTPEGKSVWIQYPINNQGFVPWTPAEYTYSISSGSSGNAFTSGATRNTFTSGATRNTFNVDERIINPNNPFDNKQQELRSNRRIITRITNNNDQSNVIGQHYEEERRFLDPVKDTIQGVIEKLPGRETDIVHGPVFQNLPSSVSDKVHGPVFQKFPSKNLEEENRFLGPSKDVIHGVMEKFPSRVSDKVNDPLKEKFPGTVMNKFSIPTENPVEVFTGRTNEDDDNTDGEVIPVTESFFDNYVINELDSTDFVERDDQVEDTTELGPVVRLTSRGRPRMSNTFPEKQNYETRTPTTETRRQSIRPRPNNPLVPSLIIDTSLSQTYIRRPSTRVNSENRFRTRRPGIVNGHRGVNPESSRNTVTGNGIARLLTLSDEKSNRGVARSPPSYSRVTHNR